MDKRSQRREKALRRTPIAQVVEEKSEKSGEEEAADSSKSIAAKPAVAAKPAAAAANANKSAKRSLDMVGGEESKTTKQLTDQV